MSLGHPIFDSLIHTCLSGFLDHVVLSASARDKSGEGSDAAHVCPLQNLQSGASSMLVCEEHTALGGGDFHVSCRRLSDVIEI